MTPATYWADGYVEKVADIKESMELIKSGHRVFISSSCGEPQHLVSGLAEASSSIHGLEIIRLLSLESTSLSGIANKSNDQNLNIRHFYLGSAKSKRFATNIRHITPINLSAVPRLFKSRKLPIDVALIQVSPPDDFGWMSLGISLDITMAAAQTAQLVIAQVNPQMPRVLGQSFLHVNDVDVIVEYEEELLSIEESPHSEAANLIARHVSRLIDHGSTMHIGLGTHSEALMLALSEKNDLGIHTQYITDDIMRLVSQGVITNRYKGINELKLVASSAIGSPMLYEFLDNNPSIDFHPSDYVNSPSIIAQHNKMISMAVVREIDLTGQVTADALPMNHYSGVTGIPDFVRGASQSIGGKSILMLSSTSNDKRISRIVPTLHETSVVVPRGDVEHVVTEFGAVNLFGKSLQERALALISIAHPDFRGYLFDAAQEMGLLSADRRQKESLKGIYPLKLEIQLEIDGKQITVRPAKPVDERLIQEHFYKLERKDIVSRFFHEKSTFLRTELENLSQVDYIKNMTLVAIVGEFGFGQVVGIGEYWLDEKQNIAEVAFSVNRDFQGKGVGKILINKLHEAALESGISGFFALTSFTNKGMINLFRCLPYPTNTRAEDDMMLLSCSFTQEE